MKILLLLVLACVVLAQDEWEEPQAPFDINSLPPVPVIPPEQFELFLRRQRDVKSIFVLFMIDDKDEHAQEIELFASSIMIQGHGEYEVGRVIRSTSRKAWTLLGVAAKTAVIIIRDGVPRQFGGSLETLKRHIEKLMAEPITYINTRKDKNAFTEKSNSYLIAYIPTADKKVEDMLVAAARQMQYAVTFGVTRDEKIARSFHVPIDAPVVIAIQHYNDKPIIYDGQLNVNEIMRWVADHRIGSLVELTRENVYEVWGMAKSTVFYFDAIGDQSKAMQTRIAAFKKVANKFGDRSKMGFVMCDVETFPELKKAMKVESVPSVKFVTGSGIEMAYSGDINYSGLSKWAEGIASNDYDNMISINNGGAKKLSVNNFREELMKASQKHVALLLMDSEAEGATELATKYDAVATHYKENDQVFVAVLPLDADTAKTTFKTETLPFLVYMDAEHAESFVPYTGAFESEAMIDFVDSVMKSEN